MPKVHINGCDISYHEYGDGPALLMLHSELLSHVSWRQQINTFANRFHVITVDIRGHGDSSITTNPYSIPLFAEDMIALADALHLDRLMVCGHALGGMIGQEMAIRYPERLDALVMADTPYTNHLTWLDTLGASLTAAASNFVNPQQRLLWKCGIRGDIEPQMRESVHREMSRHLKDADNVHNIERAIQSFDNTERLEKIQCLTLILVGEHSGGLHRHARHMTETIRGSFYGVVLNAGHMLHWDNAQLFNGITLEFLDGAAALNA